MSMPSEREQTELSEWDDEQRNMRITDKINKTVAEKLRREVEPRLKAHEQKITEHDNIFSELGSSILMGFGQIMAAGKKFTVKK